MTLPHRKWLANIAPAEEALRRADTQAELEEAWFAHCAGHAEGSRECLHLRRVYQERLAVVRAADEQRERMLRYGRAS